MSWTSPTTLKSQLRQRWERGDILAARLGGNDMFPLEIRLKRPSARDIAQRFGQVMDWVQTLQTGSKDKMGYGYELQWTTVNNRVQGTNDIPVAAVIPTETDALRFLRCQSTADHATKLASRLLARQPRLREWIVKRPFVMLEHTDNWDALLTILDWFQTHPRPGLYVRQLDIPGVATKFIEAHRGLLSELLDVVLPAEAIVREATGVRRFNARYGLLDEPVTVRFRLLDPALYIHGLCDIAVPVAEFARLQLNPKHIFVTENRINGLAFPNVTGGLVIFGLGYGVEQLASIEWLHDRCIWYWGDIDTHGFGILNQLRANLPQVRSFLMDRDTLTAHRDLWGTEPADKRYEGTPTRLTDAEFALFDDLRNDRLSPRLRLEQERIGFGWLVQALGKIST